MKAEPVEIGAEPRLAAGHPEIGNEGEPEPAADCRAMHRADDRLSRAEEADRLLVEMPPGAAATRLRHRAGVHALGKIGAGAKRASLGGEHDRAAGRVGIEPLEGFADLGDQDAVEEIMWRAADLDRRHHPLEADADLLEAGVVGHAFISLKTTEPRSLELSLRGAQRRSNPEIA